MKSIFIGTRIEALEKVEDLTDVTKIITGLEFCALMQGEITRDTLDRIIKFTKNEI